MDMDRTWIVVLFRDIARQSPTLAFRSFWPSVSLSASIYHAVAWSAITGRTKAGIIVRVVVFAGGRYAEGGFPVVQSQHHKGNVVLREVRVFLEHHLVRVPREVLALCRGVLRVEDCKHGVRQVAPPRTGVEDNLVIRPRLLHK